ncbi:UbiA family prenyltransferase [Myxococcota bacterium]|nr:UbiA family prenyltransferase [Myxococcota bacterium]MBU1382904.1 UbiA family prenyltransferase [Myxococcota bacterium]MBU1495390.1 UbiA family prenyltransferase [Myxococcota bacterium]
MTLIKFLTSVVRLMRPMQWAKNLLVFTPAMFAGILGDYRGQLYSLAAFVVFCLVSSSIYILNDIKDAQRDRLHPEKRFRPIASGEISPRQAFFIWNFITIAALIVALSVSWKVAAIGVGYIIVNVAYTLKLKHVPWLDITSIALGFIFRIHAGAAAVDVVVSVWLTINTFLLAAFLGFGKRYHELGALGVSAPESRPVLKYYTIKSLANIMKFLIVAIPFTFMGWSFARFSVKDALWIALTVPVIVFALFRFFQICSDTARFTSPTDAMLRDFPLILSTVVWSGAMVGILYL